MTTTASAPIDPVGADLSKTLRALKLSGLKDTPDRSQDECGVAGLGEPQRGQVRPQATVVGQVVVLVPGVDAHGRIEAGLARAQRRRAGLPPGYLVGEQQLEEGGVAHLVLAGQRKALGQGSARPTWPPPWATSPSAGA